MPTVEDFLREYTGSLVIQLATARARESQLITVVEQLKQELEKAREAKAEGEKPE